MSLVSFPDNFSQISLYQNILANLNNTMQTKQHAMKKNPHTHIQIETRKTRDYLLWWKDIEQEMFKIFSLC